jgi:hypothetical protein
MQPTNPTTAAPTLAGPILSLKEIAVLLVKHLDLHEGLYEAAFNLQITIGRVGLTSEAQAPGAAFAIAGLSLAKAGALGPNTVDAAEVNPATAEVVRPAAERKAARKTPAKAA